MLMKKIVVAGCGFGGAAAAISLSRKLGKHAKITAVDRTHSFDYHASLPELASGKVRQSEITIPYEKMFSGTGVTFVRDEIWSVDRKRRILKCKGTSLPYDYLVLAIGAQTNFFGIPGAEENSLEFKSFSDANLIRGRMHALSGGKKPARVAIIGGGLSGIELACELSDLSKKLSKNGGKKIGITVVDRSLRLHASLSEDVGMFIERHLKSKGITLVQGAEAKRVLKSAVVLSGGRKLDSNLTIWCAGIKPPRIVEAIAGASFDARCGIVLNNYLQSIGDSNIYAVGDCGWCSCFEGKPALTAWRAIEQADYVSHNISCEVYGIPQARLPYNPRRFHAFISLGGGFGILDYNGMWFASPIAYHLKKLGEKIHIARFRHRMEFLELADEFFLSAAEVLFRFKLWGKR